MWNPEGQFEILRILFLNKKLAGECAVAHDEVLTADSSYRNFNWHVNSLRNDLAKVKAKHGEHKAAIEELPVLQTEYEALVNKENDLGVQIERIDDEISNAEKRLYELDVAARETALKLEKSELGFFREAFPDLPDVVDRVLGSLLTNEGCLVCGSREISSRKQLLASLKAGECPICLSSKELQEVPSEVKPISDKRIKNLEKELSGLTTERLTTDKAIRSLRSDFDDLKELHRNAVRELFRAEHHLEDAKAKVPQDDSITHLLRSLDERTSELELRKHVLDRVRAKYRALLQEANDRIALSADSIVSPFQEYASAFLDEKARLSYAMHLRNIGESGSNMKFPTFAVHMSSGTFQVPHLRATSDSVSESQREFLDLAFRMALLRAASVENCAAMIVIETPEAGLDSLFVERAGEMLRKFCRRPRGGKGNSLIATINLNQENMLSSLLGIDAKWLPGVLICTEN